MGNSGSSVDSSLSRSGSVDPRRNQSQSPVTHRRTGSLRRTTEQMPGKPFRRSKTCRTKDNQSVSIATLLLEKNARKAICMTTGLTLHQKAVLTRKWNRMDRGTVYEIGRLMFENVFVENPQYLSYLDLRDEPNWLNHINFKIHVQRFNTALTEVMRRLREPSGACDILRDFGAGYATNSKRVSAMYFERLANALNRAAAELQEGDHLQVEKTGSCNETCTETTVSSEWENSNMGSSQTLSDCSSLRTVKSASRVSEGSRPGAILTRNSESQMETLQEEVKTSNNESCETHSHNEKEKKEDKSHHSDGSCSAHSHGDKSLCPITAEAWIVLSAFLANQIKLGYELERVLKSEMDKLGLDCLIAPSSTLDSDMRKRAVHA